jgi:hypothetical protein
MMVIYRFGTFFSKDSSFSLSGSLWVPWSPFPCSSPVLVTNLPHPRFPKEPPRARMYQFIS